MVPYNYTLPFFQWHESCNKMCFQKHSLLKTKYSIVVKRNHHFVFANRVFTKRCEQKLLPIDTACSDANLLASIYFPVSCLPKFPVNGGQYTGIKPCIIYWTVAEQTVLVALFLVRYFQPLWICLQTSLGKKYENYLYPHRVSKSTVVNASEGKIFLR